MQIQKFDEQFLLLFCDISANHLQYIRLELTGQRAYFIDREQSHETMKTLEGKVKQKIVKGKEVRSFKSQSSDQMRGTIDTAGVDAFYFIFIVIKHFLF